MANQEDELLHNHPAAVQHMAGPAAVQGQLDRLRYQLLDAARALMLLAVGLAAAVLSAVGNNNNSSLDDADSAALVLVVLALVTWLLGVCLLSLVPVAGRFPQVAALACAAIATARAVLVRLFTPWN